MEERKLTPSTRGEIRQPRGAKPRKMKTAEEEKESKSQNKAKQRESES